MKILAVVAALSGTALAKPAVELLPLDGYAQKIVAPHHGRRFAVNFWATWCDPCREELPSLLAAASAAKLELVLISLDSADHPEPLQKFLDSVHAAGSWVVAAGDPQSFIDGVDKSWDGTLPFTVVYSAAGKAVSKLRGGQGRADFDRAFKP